MAQRKRMKGRSKATVPEKAKTIKASESGPGGGKQERPRPEPKGFRILMRPPAFVLWLSFMWYRWQDHERTLSRGTATPKEQSYSQVAVTAIWELLLGLGCEPRGGRDAEGKWPHGAPPDFEEWADRMVGDRTMRPDGLEDILPAWLRTRRDVQIDAYVDLPHETWRTILSETAAVADRDPGNDLWDGLLFARNCDLGTYDGHVMLLEELLGEILRGLCEASPRNLLAWSEWELGWREGANGRPLVRPFALWRETALLSWTRALAGVDP